MNLLKIETINLLFVYLLRHILKCQCNFKYNFVTFKNNANIQYDKIMFLFICKQLFLIVCMLKITSYGLYKLDKKLKKILQVFCVKIPKSYIPK